ncbi:MAG: lysylphosphatidylglycerol synthase transmembrane domain-containing protein [Gammaproteobacteria bacterium]
MRTIYKTIVAFVLVGLLIWFLGGLDKLASVLLKAEPFYIVLAVGIATLDRALMTYKWRLLLLARHVDLHFLYGFKIYCASMIWGIFLPSGIGADIIRAYEVCRAGLPGNEVIASIIVERMVGFIVSLVLGLFGLYILGNSATIGTHVDLIWWSGVAAMACATILFSASFSPVLFQAIYKWFPRPFIKSKVGMRLKKLHETYSGYRTSGRAIAIFFGLTLLENIVSIALTVVVIEGLGIDVNLWLVSSAVLLTVLVARLPISIDGIGVAEGIFALLMGLVGVPAAESVATILIVRLVQICAWLPWWLVWVIESGSFRPRAPRENLPAIPVPQRIDNSFNK